MVLLVSCWSGAIDDGLMRGRVLQCAHIGVRGRAWKGVSVRIGYVRALIGCMRGC